MSTVAVTGASSPVGKALLERLDADEAVSRILGLDVAEPEMPVAKLDYRVTDLRDPLLPAALEGAEAIVHLALDLQLTESEDTLFARNVHGTRNLLNAASKVGARTVVHLSHAAAYGAHPDNPVPITEEAPLRANPDYPPAYHALLAEELVAEFAESHPQSRVVVLRTATVLGLGADSMLAQLLEGPRVIAVRGYRPPVQVVHVDDLAAALHLATTGGLAGTYNVAADGWLALDELCGLLGRRPLAVPETFAFAAARQLWSRGLSPAPPGVVHFLMHPLVLAPAKLHRAGWSPTRSNREVLREFVAERAGWVRFGRLRLRRRQLYAAAVASAAGLAAGTVLARRRAGAWGR